MQHKSVLYIICKCSGYIYCSTIVVKWCNRVNVITRLASTNYIVLDIKHITLTFIKSRFIKHPTHHTISKGNCAKCKIGLIFLSRDNLFLIMFNTHKYIEIFSLWIFVLCSSMFLKFQDTENYCPKEYLIRIESILLAHHFLISCYSTLHRCYWNYFWHLIIFLGYSNLYLLWSFVWHLQCRSYIKQALNFYKFLLLQQSTQIDSLDFPI